VVVLVEVLSPEVLDVEGWKVEGRGRVSEAQSPRLRRRKGFGVIGSGTMVLSVEEVMKRDIDMYKRINGT